jgi:hypothetical protein
MADLYEREGSHLLASLGPEELGRVLSQHYDRHPVPDYERLLATTHAHLQRQAVAALGAAGGLPGRDAERDPYVLWVHEQLDLFARFLDEIEPRTAETRMAIERASRRVRMDRILSPIDVTRPIVDVATSSSGTCRSSWGSTGMRAWTCGPRSSRTTCADCQSRRRQDAPRGA